MAERRAHEKAEKLKALKADWFTRLMELLHKASEEDMEIKVTAEHAFKVTWVAYSETETVTLPVSPGSLDDDDLLMTLENEIDRRRFLREDEGRTRQLRRQALAKLDDDERNALNLS